MSRVGIISDVHSNMPALTEAFRLLDKHRVDDVICLGDVVGYGPEPMACLKLIKAHCTTLIQGNHDAAVGDEDEYLRMNHLAMAGVDFAREQLDPDCLKYLNGHPRMLVCPGSQITLAHGSITGDHFDYIVNGLSAYENFLLMETRLLLVGHSHLAFISEYKSSMAMDVGELSLTTFRQKGEFERQLMADSRYIINPGSVGQPRDIPLASLCILDDNGQKLTSIRFPYDVSASKKKIIEAGLPDLAWQRLELGR